MTNVRRGRFGLECAGVLTVCSADCWGGVVLCLGGWCGSFCFAGRCCCVWAGGCSVAGDCSSARGRSIASGAAGDAVSG